MLLSAAGVDPRRPLADQADAFWWSAQGDSALDAALAQSAIPGWQRLARLVRGTGAASDEAADDRRVLTVTRGRPALIALDAAGALLERIEA